MKPPNHPLELTTYSEQQTDLLGALLARCIRPPATIALHGELGAGKTRLVRAFVAGVGDHESLVCSPTFVLINEYTARIPIVHVDAYRLEGSDELEALGIDELLEGDKVCFIEWAVRVRDILPQDHLDVTITHAGPESRTFRFEGTGPRSWRVVDVLRWRVERQDHAFTA